MLILHYSVNQRSWDCSTCKEDVELAGAAYAQKEGIEEWIKALEGKAFCKSPGLGLTEEQIETCKMIILEFIPFALKQMKIDIRENSQRICNVWFDGTCEYP